MPNGNILPLLENFIVDSVEVPQMLGALYHMTPVLLQFKQLLPVLAMSSHEYVVSYFMNDIYEPE